MKASTGVRQTAADSRELVISETGQRFLEMDLCFMWGSTSDHHSFDCLARLSLQVPEVLQLELLASFQTGSSSRGASCHQVGCD
ncbi:unnamed protein product [Pleuronectes platessa]|uniref:Uncharacterized protein n=1 Tax=Pleuronectes platessa TaxID=8262 RepID=A0A9N7VVK6_PLEPL|nr:unnamed protein product [Pleuronectes platessa]